MVLYQEVEETEEDQLVTKISPGGGADDGGVRADGEVKLYFCIILNQRYNFIKIFCIIYLIKNN